jgi:hypothetical protein
MDDNAYFDEMEYSEEEEQQVIHELTLGLMTQEIHKIVTKKKLKSWFADVEMKKRGEFCPNITGDDLIAIAKKIGIEVEN